MNLRNVTTVIHRIASHPSAARTGKLTAISRFLTHQALKRLDKSPRVIDAFGTAKLICYGDSSASNAVFYHGYPDWDEMQLLARLLREGDGFLDVGANVGIFSVLAWTRIRPSGRVIAFEPEPGVRQRLLANFRINEIPVQGVHPEALGSLEDSMPFETNKDCVGHLAPYASSNTIMVQVSTLDRLVDPDEANLVAGKIDIEGHEIQALMGADRLLTSGKPFCWIVETAEVNEANREKRAELQLLLMNYGYDLYQAAEDGTALRAVPLGGPFPNNCFAIRDTARLVERVPGLRVTK